MRRRTSPTRAYVRNQGSPGQAKEKSPEKPQGPPHGTSPLTFIDLLMRAGKVGPKLEEAKRTPVRIRVRRIEDSQVET